MRLLVRAMPEFKITADPDQDVGIGIGQSFIAFEGVHDVATSPITKKRRYIVNLTPDDILWTIEALAKELPEVLHGEAIQSIERLTSA
jgi:hypothetical protein